MITELKIKNFRGLEDVSFTGLSRVNLISGRNGVGKTSVLEALYLAAAPAAQDPITSINNVRGFTTPNVDDLFADVFTDFDDSRTIEIATGHGFAGSFAELSISSQERVDQSSSLIDAQASPASILDGSSRTLSQFEIVFKRRFLDGSKTKSKVWLSSGIPSGRQADAIDYRVEMHMPPEAQHHAEPVYYLSPSGLRSPLTWATMFGKLQTVGSDADLLEILRSVEPRVESVLSITSQRGVAVHSKIAGMRRVLPLELVGQGLKRVFELAVLTRSAQDGTLIIDEIENGIHFRSLTQMFSQLYELAERFNVQIFAVTRSDECVDAARVAIGATESRGLSYYRLGREKGKIRAHHFDIDKLNRAHDARMEVR